MIGIIKVMRYVLVFVALLFPFFSHSINEEPGEGERLFVEKRCATCHVIGRGKFVGPDLYYSLDKYPVQEILQWIQNPQSIYKKYAKMPINQGYPPMPNLNINSQEAKKLLKYIEETRNQIRPRSKVKIMGSLKAFGSSKYLDGQEVQLELVMADKVLDTKKITTEKGKFVFKNLIGNIAYRIKIFYDGIEYSTDKFYFLPKENNKNIDLTVYDSVQDPNVISVDSSHLIISYEEDTSSVTVAEIFNIKNSSKNIFVGTNNLNEKVRKINSYALFPGIDNLGFPHRTSDTYIISDEKVIDTLPMPPGNRRVVFTYSKELNFFSTKISKVFMNNISSLTIIVPENKLSLAIKGLEYTKKEAGIEELAGERYTTYSLKNITKGQEIVLIFKKYDFFLNTKIITFSIFIIFIFGIFFYKRIKKNAE